MDGERVGPSFMPLQCSFLWSFWLPERCNRQLHLAALEGGSTWLPYVVSAKTVRPKMDRKPYREALASSLGPLESVGAKRSCVTFWQMPSNIALTTTHHLTPSHTIIHLHTPSTKKTHVSYTCLQPFQLCPSTHVSACCRYTSAVNPNGTWEKDALAISKVVPRLSAFTCANDVLLDKACVHRIDIFKIGYNHSRSTLGSNPNSWRRL